jgi:hypothetical protein
MLGPVPSIHDFRADGRIVAGSDDIVDGKTWMAATRAAMTVEV